MDFDKLSKMIHKMNVKYQYNKTRSMITPQPVLQKKLIEKHHQMSLERGDGEFHEINKITQGDL
jgi:hypothetical protein